MLLGLITTLTACGTPPLDGPSGPPLDIDLHSALIKRANGFHDPAERARALTGISVQHLVGRCRTVRSAAAPTYACTVRDDRRAQAGRSGADRAAHAPTRTVRLVWRDHGWNIEGSTTGRAP